MESGYFMLRRRGGGQRQVLHKIGEPDTVFAKGNQ